MAVTIKDVAAKAGVARSTVSKVISDHPSISDATKKRIRAIMQEMDYTPNRLAQGFAHQKSYTVGVLMELQRFAAFKNPYVFEILCGIEQSAGVRNYNVALHNLVTVHEELDQLRRVINEKRVDGFILHASDSIGPIVELMNQLSVPFVIIGEPGFIGEHCWVDIDNRFAGFKATSHLIELGYRNLAFVGGPSSDGITQERQQGFVEAVKKAGLEAVSIMYGEDKSVQSGADVWRKELLPEIDGVVAADSTLGVGVIQEARRQGIVIPEKLGVIGFDNHPIAEASQPKLTVLDLGLFALGNEAAEALFQLISKPQSSFQKRIPSGQIIARASTRTPT
jgi:DNA-binding LacI/PurR family transcriptional regulator